MSKPFTAPYAGPMYSDADIYESGIQAGRASQRRSPDVKYMLSALPGLAGEPPWYQLEALKIFRAGFREGGKKV